MRSWGNSIGDFIANTVVAKQGFPEMAISAAYGGPLFNMLCGIGIGVTYHNIVAHPHELTVAKPSNETVNAFTWLSLSLLMSLIVIPMTGFIIRRPFAVVLIIVYVLATTFGLLAEFNIISYGLDPVNNIH